MSDIKRAKDAIKRLEDALIPAQKLARIAHHSVMRASEAIGEQNDTGAAHSCLALMELAVRALNQANDAARYSRNSMEYPQ